MSGSQPDPKDGAKRLLAYLRRLKNDRGAMADLRCALNPSKLPRAWPLLGRVGGIGNPRIEAVAGLFAYHPDETHTGNIGTTCYRLAAENNSFDARFRRLLSCDRDEICDRLRPVILAAKPKGIPINYEELYTDLCYWPGNVKARWAREYWGAPEAEEPAPLAVSEATP
ncbi:MAG: type I-E CRISPR-associated protein Cse2/CasB [Terriglobia bacterium]|jgi:CRISPR system Cascade subunit CasB